MNRVLQIITLFIQSWVDSFGLSPAIGVAASNVVFIVLAVAIAIAAYMVVRLLYNLFTKKVVARTATHWDDYIFGHKLFSRLLYYLPLLILYGILSARYHAEQVAPFIDKTTFVALILLTVRNIHLFLQMMLHIYQGQKFAQRRPLKGIAQVITIFVYIIGALLSITTVLDVSPLTLLGGVGALSAVVLLIFKDPILGIVSGIHLSANNMLQIGDWIEVPEHNADGEVIDITMQSVRVRNWNKTIVSLPIYSLVSQSFINWRGMAETGGRRIKRAIAIDVNSVRFCDRDMVERFKRFSLIKEYLERKEKEIVEHNRSHKLDDLHDVASSRALTNLGTFRAYIYAYLRTHPLISHTLTLMVRHLQPTTHGIPIQIYAFCNDIVWENYESVQADIFDHIIASTKEFGLKIYQSPSGSEVLHLIEAYRKD